MPLAGAVGVEAAARGPYRYMRYTLPTAGSLSSSSSSSSNSSSAIDGGDGSYYAARDFCTAHGSTLLTLSDASEYEALFVGRDALLPVLGNTGAVVWLGLVNDTSQGYVEVRSAVQPQYMYSSSMGAGGVRGIARHIHDCCDECTVYRGSPVVHTVCTGRYKAADSPTRIW